MSKHKIDITKKVMSKIKTEQIKMKPKWYFWLGSLSILVALVGLFFVLIFLISLITFSLRSHGPMGAIRYQQILFSFPWWAPIVIAIGLIIGTVLLKKYDFSYKHNFLVIIIIFISAILLTGIFINTFGLDNFWIKRGPMKRFYQNYDGNRQRLNINNKQNGRGNRNFPY